MENLEFYADLVFFGLIYLTLGWVYARIIKEIEFESKDDFLWYLIYRIAWPLFMLLEPLKALRAVYVWWRDLPDGDDPLRPR